MSMKAVERSPSQQPSFSLNLRVLALAGAIVTGSAGEASIQAADQPLPANGAGGETGGAASGRNQFTRPLTELEVIEALLPPAPQPLPEETVVAGPPPGAEVHVPPAAPQKAEPAAGRQSESRETQSNGHGDPDTASASVGRELIDRVKGFLPAKLDFLVDAGLVLFAVGGIVATYRSCLKFWQDHIKKPAEALRDLEQRRKLRTPIFKLYRIIDEGDALKLDVVPIGDRRSLREVFVENEVAAKVFESAADKCTANSPFPLAHIPETYPWTRKLMLLMRGQRRQLANVSLEFNELIGDFAKGLDLEFRQVMKRQGGFGGGIYFLVPFVKQERPAVPGAGSNHKEGRDLVFGLISRNDLQQFCDPEAVSRLIADNPKRRTRIEQTFIPAVKLLLGSVATQDAVAVSALSPHMISANSPFQWLRFPERRKPAVLSPERNGARNGTFHPGPERSNGTAGGQEVESRAAQ